MQYDRFGAVYGATVDNKPHIALYERPALLSLLPPLAGLSVLDAGCGNGWYAEMLLDAGATVTAFDASAEMVRQTRARIGERAQVVQASLAEPLTFAGEGAFDLVIAPLCLHYVADWVPVFAKFFRVLRPGGSLVFSTHHPFADWENHAGPTYFATEEVREVWDSGIGEVRFYRRPLGEIVGPLIGAGFRLDMLLEPRPVAAFAERNKAVYEKLLRFPAFGWCGRVVREGSGVEGEMTWRLLCCRRRWYRTSRI